MSVKSMTGFGRAALVFEGKEICIEIKSVNHRYFDLNIRLSREYSFLEEKLKTKIQKFISRGKVDLFVFIEKGVEPTVTLQVNDSLVEEYKKACKYLQDKHGITDDISASDFLRVPELLYTKPIAKDEQKVLAQVLEVLDAALLSYDQMRNTEGKATYDTLCSELEKINFSIAKIQLLAEDTVINYKTRLYQKIKEVLEDRAIDEARVLTEIAIFADKVDTGEEIVRLQSHINQFKALLDMGTSAIGKKLDFIVQEMNREANTINSKCNNLDITNFVVDIKSYIEKIREQIQNIE